MTCLYNHHNHKENTFARTDQQSSLWYLHNPQHILRQIHYQQPIKWLYDIHLVLTRLELCIVFKCARKEWQLRLDPKKTHADFMDVLQMSLTSSGTCKIDPFSFQFCFVLLLILCAHLRINSPAWHVHLSFHKIIK